MSARAQATALHGTRLQRAALVHEGHATPRVTREHPTCERAGVQAEALDANLTVMDTLVRAAPDAQLNDVKALLGRMMFTGRSVQKKARSVRQLGS